MADTTAVTRRKNLADINVGKILLMKTLCEPINKIYFPLLKTLIKEKKKAVLLQGNEKHGKTDFNLLSHH